MITFPLGTTKYAKVTKSYQFENEKDSEFLVQGTEEEILEFAKALGEPDTEEGHTIDFDHRGDSEVVNLATGKNEGILKGENKISFVHWVSEPSTDPDFPDEPDHYWNYVVNVKFVDDVVEECRSEVLVL